MNIFRERTFQVEAIARPVDRRKEKKIAIRRSWGLLSE